MLAVWSHKSLLHSWVRTISLWEKVPSILFESWKISFLKKKKSHCYLITAFLWSLCWLLGPELWLSDSFIQKPLCFHQCCSCQIFVRTKLFSQSPELDAISRVTSLKWSSQRQEASWRYQAGRDRWSVKVGYSWQAFSCFSLLRVLRGSMNELQH